MPSPPDAPRPDAVIRPAVVADAHAIAEVRAAGWRHAYRGILPDATLDGIDIAAGAERLRGAIARRAPGSRLLQLVLELEGRVEGWLAQGPYREDGAEPEPGIGELWALYVQPRRIGQGHGRALLEVAQAAARQAGFHELRLWVLEENGLGRRFYERQGFEQDGRVERRTHADTGAFKVRYVLFLRRGPGVAAPG